jgi:hypothetical protein|tara:strand:+ start:811 stop:957 length:147 start_codon:yes stop_codon:yes gene_type:complete
MWALIMIIVMVIIVCLGKYAIAEGQRIERQKKMIKDMERFDNIKKLKK